MVFWDSVLSQLEIGLSDLRSALGGRLSLLLTQVENAVNNVVSVVEANNFAQTAEVTSVVNQAYRDVSALGGSLVGDEGAALESIISALRAGVEIPLGETRTTFDAIGEELDKLQKSIEKDFIDVTSLAESVSEQLDKVEQAVKGGEFSLNKVVIEVDSSIRDAVGTLQKALPAWEQSTYPFHYGASKEMSDRILRALNSQEPELSSPLFDYLRSLGITQSPAAAAGAVGGFIGGSLAQPAIAPLMTALQQTAYWWWPNKTPGPSDLVRFQLREVFRPTFLARQLYDPTTDQFFKDPNSELPGLRKFYNHMRENGFSVEWSNYFWAAHWELPSVQMAFEMFHRLRPDKFKDPNIAFTRMDLRELLTRLDVAPEYIERLIQLSFLPYTRVDIRRMYRVGVLNEEEVFSAYMDLGYDAERARKLTEFTTKWAGNQDVALSKGEVKAAYLEGELSREEAAKALEAIGIRGRNAEIVLAIEDRKRARRLEREARKAEREGLALISLVKRQLSAGLLTREQAREKLAPLDLPEDSLSQILGEAPPPS